MRRPLIVGNWKMHNTVSESIKLATTVKNLIVESPHIEVVVTPPFTSLYSVSIVLADTNVKLGAQNLFWEEEGAYTGEICGSFLKDVHCEFVIIGHSERRQYFAETDKIVGQKIQAALKADLIPIACVGESNEIREKGQTLEFIEAQLKTMLKEVAIHDFERMVIAYEPIWAIGSGKTATPEQAGEVHEMIRHWLMRYFDAPTANKIHILYGGSVKPANAAELMSVAEVDGLLVGGASIEAGAFAKIVQFEESN